MPSNPMAGRRRAGLTAVLVTALATAALAGPGGVATAATDPARGTATPTDTPAPTAGAAMPGGGSLTRPQADPVDGGYTSADVGFAEGSSIGDDLAARLDGMAAYVPGRSPLVRVDLNWWYVQSCRECGFVWDQLDRIVDGARTRGMRVLVILDYAPPWANGGHADDKWFPTGDADWTTLVDQAVAHLAGRVTAYEVWNEPNNIGVFANYATDPVRRYWELAKLAYQRIHAACSNCVVLAGASGNGTLVDGVAVNESVRWLEWAYANDFGGAFDALTHHPYPAWSVGFGPERAECAIPWWNQFGPPGEDPPCGELAALHAVMARNGQPDKKIWGTEWGYPTSGAAGTPLTTIRDYQVTGVRMWRALSYAGPLFLFSYRDACANAANPECNYGVVTTGGTRKEPLFTDLATELRCTTGCQPPPSPSPTLPASLSSGGTLLVSAGMQSDDGRFQLWLQSDGNLVLYRKVGAVPLWASNTTDGVRLVNQADGNLALLRANGTATWQSKTAGKGRSTLWLQDDGNLVLYRDSDAKPTWATNTAS